MNVKYVYNYGKLCLFLFFSTVSCAFVVIDSAYYTTNFKIKLLLFNKFKYFPTI